jgi:hypothetical protein
VAANEAAIESASRRSDLEVLLALQNSKKKHCKRGNKIMVGQRCKVTRQIGNNVKQHEVISDANKISVCSTSHFSIALALAIWHFIPFPFRFTCSV